MTSAIVRRDERGKPPSIWLIALRVGAAFGVIAGVGRAIVSWLQVGSALTAFYAWGITAVATALGVTFLYLLALRINTAKGVQIESTEQRTVLQVDLPVARAFAVAVKALRGIDEALHDVDLVAGTASVEQRVKERFFGTIHLRLGATVKSAANGAEIALESHAILGAIDFGASRRLIDELVRRVEELIASGHVAADAVGLEAIPAAAREMFRANGYRVVGLRSLPPEAPGVAVNLLAEGDAPARAVVLTLAGSVPEAVLRRVAERVRAGGASQSRAGNGFAIVPLIGGEAPAKIAARVHQALRADDATIRTRAPKHDDRDQAPTTRMKRPPR